eukprot:Opistho-2@95499
MTRARFLLRSIKRNEVFAQAKGYFGRRKNVYSVAVRAVRRTLQYKYISRKLVKRDMRSLWVQRINASARQLNITYGHFMHNLSTANVMINRKMLSELAIYEPRTFKGLADFAKARRDEGILALAEKEAARNPFVVHATTPRASPK